MNPQRVIIVALCLLAGPVHAGEPWDAVDATLGATAAAALVVDWRQTREIRAPMIETNRILGEHPSTARIDGYFIGAALVGYLIADALPRPWRRAFLTGGAVIELTVVRKNRLIGLHWGF